MNILEVFSSDKDLRDNWFRPVSWKHCREAYCVIDGDIYLVPTSRGGSPQFTRFPSEIVGEWEIVDPDVVLNGD